LSNEIPGRGVFDRMIGELTEDDKRIAEMGRELARLRKAMRIARDLCLSSAPKQAVGEVLAAALAERTA
jgi:hypothetical protein